MFLGCCPGRRPGRDDRRSRTLREAHRIKGMKKGASASYMSADRGKLVKERPGKHGTIVRGVLHGAQTGKRNKPTNRATKITAKSRKGKR